MTDITDIRSGTAAAAPLLDRPGAPSLDFYGIATAHQGTADDPKRLIADWVRDYLTRPHPELGRTGHVCPFTAQATRLDTVRIGVSPLTGADRTAIHETMKEALRAFNAIPCKRAGRQFRTVIVGFPNCAGSQGEEALKYVQRAMRHHSTLQAKMIGLFGPDSKHKGLLNPSFQSQRSPIPVLAIRMLVEKDAPFVVRNPLLVPIYLMKFPVDGTRRLVEQVRAKLFPSK